MKIPPYMLLAFGFLGAPIIGPPIFHLPGQLGEGKYQSKNEWIEEMDPKTYLACGLNSLTSEQLMSLGNHVEGLLLEERNSFVSGTVGELEGRISRLQGARRTLILGDKEIQKVAQGCLSEMAEIAKEMGLVDEDQLKSGEWMGYAMAIGLFESSSSHWNWGSGPGSKSHWNFGSGKGSKGHWNFGSGEGARGHWLYGSGNGSRGHWLYGSGLGSNSHWKFGEGYGSSTFWLVGRDEGSYRHWKGMP